MACLVALALVFLISNLNTLLLVDSESKMKMVEADLQIASKIQMDALPTSDPDFGDQYPMTLRAIMDTAKEVGGDFYDYFPINDHKVCFLMADVSGKGTPAALFMMLILHPQLSDMISAVRNATALDDTLAESAFEAMLSFVTVNVLLSIICL